MFTKQLYRYIFIDWDNLSDEERTAAPEFFKLNDPMDKLRKILKAQKNETLYTLVYGDKKPEQRFNALEYSPGDDQFNKFFNAYDQKHYYFATYDKSSILDAYKSMYLVCKCIGKLFGDHRYGSTNAYVMAYKLLVLFGSERSIEDALSAFDMHCKTNKNIEKNNLVSDIVNIHLRSNEKQQFIHLEAWRTIFQTEGLNATLPLFYIASEIEEKLGRAPVNFQEALTSAQSIQFTNATQCPELAGMCVASLIPEELFDECLNNDPSIKKLARANLLGRIPQQYRIDFVRLVPVEHMDLKEFIEFLRLLKDEEQLAFMTRFSPQLSPLITQKRDFFQILTSCKHPDARAQLLTLVSTNILSWIDNITSLVSLLEPFDDIARNHIIQTVVGIQKIKELINSSYAFEQFLEHILPVNSPQVPYLMQTVIAEDIRLLTNNPYHLKNQLIHIKPEEQLSYIKQILGADNIRSIIKDHLWILKMVLKSIRQEDRLTFLFDVIGVEQLQRIVLRPQDKQGEETVLSVLGPEQKEEFLDRLTPDEEKYGKAQILLTKMRILTIDFPLGIGGLGMSGKNITLDDGRLKAVPFTVAKQWEQICLAEQELITFTEAWDLVQKLAREANSNPHRLSFLSRATCTTDYYKSFSDDLKSIESFQPG